MFQFAWNLLINFQSTCRANTGYITKLITWRVFLPQTIWRWIYFYQRKPNVRFLVLWLQYWLNYLLWFSNVVTTFRFVPRSDWWPFYYPVIIKKTRTFRFRKHNKYEETWHFECFMNLTYTEFIEVFYCSVLCPVGASVCSCIAALIYTIFYYKNIRSSSHTQLWIHGSCCWLK